MNIVVNTLPLKSGGGVQVALDFVEQARRSGGDHNWFLVATEGTPIAAVKPCTHVTLAAAVPDNLAARAWFECVGCRDVVRSLRADVVFTLFGGHWPGVPNVPSVIGCALPYLAYPDGVALWKHESVMARVRLRMSIAHNSRRLRRADVVVFETRTMADRTTRNLDLDPSRVKVVRPTCSSFVHPDQAHAETAARCLGLPSGFRILFLSGYYPHKNFGVLARVAEALKRSHGMNDVRFVTTLMPTLQAARALYEDAAARGVADMLFNVGPVPQVGCAEVYKAVDAVILPSRLESFSNTIAEAWTMLKPLLVSDLDWAREACGNAALYIAYDDAADTASQIAALRADPTIGQRLVEAGVAMRQTYPTPKERYSAYCALIEAAASAGARR